MKTAAVSAGMFFAVTLLGFSAMADPCEGTLVEIVDCLNNKLSHVEVFTDLEGVDWVEVSRGVDPILIQLFKEVNPQVDGGSIFNQVAKRVRPSALS